MHIVKGQFRANHGHPRGRFSAPLALAPRDSYWTTAHFKPQLLPTRWLPQFNLVAFGIDHPGKDPVLRLVNLVEHIASFLFQHCDCSGTADPMDAPRRTITFNAKDSISRSNGPLFAMN